MRHLNYLLLSLVITLSAGAATFSDCFELQDIQLPEGVPPEVGAIDFGPDGTLYVALRRGDILTAQPVRDPKKFDWKLFATGFHNPCGIDVPRNGVAIISQMAELTRVSDTDRDGRADDFVRLGSDWGLSGNYHETSALCGDGRGGYYVAVGTASHNGPTFEHTQGEFSKFGRRGRNYSSVKYRGWVLHYSKDGTMTPIASGFRMHNGIFQDSKGVLWCGDNQGDWKAATPLYHVEKGKFYGHPSSLVWDDRWPKDKDPMATYRADLDAYNQHRTYPAVILPHQELCRSAAEPMEIPRGLPFARQLLLTDNAGDRICRIMLEKVNGTYQGAATLFTKGNGLRTGNNRLRFSPQDKSLYVGQTVRGWGAPSEGLQRFNYRGGEPFDVEQFKLTKSGFRLKFTQKLNDASIAKDQWKVQSFTYQSKWTYGSPQENKRTDSIVGFRRRGSSTIEVNLDKLEAGSRVYQFDLPALKARDGSELSNRRFYYTVNKLR